MAPQGSSSTSVGSTTECSISLPFNGLSFHLIQDLAYADIAFDASQPPIVLDPPGAKEVAVEFFTLSKKNNMPGWRIGFMVG